VTFPSATPVSFDQIADRYDATRGGLARGRECAEDVAAWLVPGRTLEVGVGTGAVATALREDGVDIVGLDVSSLMAARAVERIGPRVALGDARSLPVADASVDNVVFVWVLHLAGGVPGALAEATRVLRPGGRVIAIHDAPQTTRTDINGPFDKLFGPLRAGRVDSRATVAAAAGDAGLVTVHQGDTTPREVPTTPAESAAAIEARTWSYLWRLDDEEWQTRVVPIIDELRALPEPDRVRSAQQWHSISVFTRP
jgi:SAM-dependent methyltransferase